MFQKEMPLESELITIHDGKHSNNAGNILQKMY
jgi:hypothetical protein